MDVRRTASSHETRVSFTEHSAVSSIAPRHSRRLDHSGLTRYFCFALSTEVMTVRFTWREGRIALRTATAERKENL